ncbi:MAG: hypothetical protein LBD77_11490 [Bifidobacteriaceae bacterium]|jgi:hypothetical protein|nr:hypothetical protein [Bifidobacteriaceae bacterium]
MNSPIDPNAPADRPPRRAHEQPSSFTPVPRGGGSIVPPPPGFAPPGAAPAPPPLAQPAGPIYSYLTPPAQPPQPAQLAQPAQPPQPAQPTQPAQPPSGPAGPGPAAPPEPAPRRSKPILKRWWFWAILALVALAAGAALVLSQGDEPSAPEPKPSPSLGAGSAASGTGDPTAGGEPTASGGGRDNSAAVKVTLTEGSYTVGTDIQPGHYEITSDGDLTGSLRIESPTDPFKANELLGEGEFGLGSPKYITDLATGDVVRWQGAPSITLTPAETRLMDRLTPGNYVVGLDVAPGAYTVKPVGEWSGNLLVYATDSTVLVNEIIDAGADDLPITLQDGQLVSVSGVTLEFEPA